MLSYSPTKLLFSSSEGLLRSAGHFYRGNILKMKNFQTLKFLFFYSIKKVTQHQKLSDLQQFQLRFYTASKMLYLAISSNQPKKIKKMDKFKLIFQKILTLPQKNFFCAIKYNVLVLQFQSFKKIQCCDKCLGLMQLTILFVIFWRGTFHPP